MQLIATLAVVISVLVLAYQGRELAGHTRVANEVAGTEAHREILVHWKSIMDAFIEHPELHAHYFGETSGDATAGERVRLRMIAEQHADWLEAGLITNEQLRSYGRSIGDWTEYAADALASSPVLRSVVRQQPGTNPPVDILLADYDTSHGAEDTGANRSMPARDQQ
jgi:hypothetical protein